jgi:hypothetical protein
MTTSELLQRGRLEQACSDCGRWEAAGAYCTGCERPMVAADWYPNGQAGRREATRQFAALRARTPLKGVPDQSTAHPSHTAAA